MSRFGMVGDAYAAQSLKFSNSRAINVYCEPIGGSTPGKGGSNMMLVKIPGLLQTHELPDKPLRCLYSGDGIRVFAVSGSTLYELFQDATFNSLGTVEYANSPAQIFSNGNQLFVVSGSGGYIPDGLGTCKRVVDCCMGGYLDGYFIGLDGAAPGQSKTFQISALLDGNSWDVLDFANVDQSPDNIQSFIVDHRQIQFLKQQTGETFWDSGNPDFPMQPVDGSFVEQGSIAPWSQHRADNTTVWLGGDERGAGIVWRAQGYTPSRVSNFAVEAAIQQYPQAGFPISDAVCMVEQYLGHTFSHFSFPTADATWVLDHATGLWHQRGSWDAVNGVWHCHKARYHCYAWGKHLVGGGDTTGRVYDQNITYQDDAGDPLRWLRQCPHLSDPTGKKTFYSNLFLDFQVGVGVDTLVDVDGLPRQPEVMVRHSNDGGHTWNAEEQLPMGKAGQYSFRVRQPLCGSGFDRNIEISGTDPVEIALVEADITAEQGIS